MKKNYPLIKLTLILCLAFSMLLPSIALADSITYGSDIPPATITTAPTFTDVPTGYWAFDAISEMAKLKIIKGYPDSLFRPERTVTRAEFAKIMSLALGVKPIKSQYTDYIDTPVNHWASPFINAVKPYMTYYRISSSKGFKPEEPAIREDISVALVKYKGYDERLADESIVDAMFSDVDGMSVNLKNAVALAVENKLISGYPDGTFKPQGSITRAEAATLLFRARQLGNDNKAISEEVPVTPEVFQSVTPDIPSVDLEIPSTPKIENNLPKPSWTLIAPDDVSHESYKVDSSVYVKISSISQRENYPTLKESNITVSLTVTPTDNYTIDWKTWDNPFFLIDDNGIHYYKNTKQQDWNLFTHITNQTSGTVSFAIPNSATKLTFKMGTLSMDITK